MNYKEYKQLIASDAYRYGGVSTVKEMLKLYFRTPGFNYSCKMRFVNLCYSSRGVFKIIYPIAYLAYRHAMFKYGISIPYKTTIGKGFYIGHFGGIVINSDTIIGNNVNISQGVTIGQAGKTGKKKSPVIGDCVYIGPNSTLVGNITIGNFVAVGANAFVNDSIEDGITVGGVPAKVISKNGSLDYIHYIWEDNK